MAKGKIDEGWHEHLKKIGSLGGKAKNQKLKPEDLAAHMEKMRAARKKKD